MNTIEFLAQLSERGVKLWVENERLRFRAPQNALTESMRAEIAQRRDEILRFLHQSQERTRGLEITIPTVPRDAPLPLSFAQERLWFLDQWQPGGSSYHVPLLVRLRGRLDHAALRASIAGIVRRHESLRTTFEMVEGQPIQVIHADMVLTLHEHDLRALPAVSREAEAARLTTELTQQPFDLQRGPLSRVMLVQLDDDDHHLLLVMHHIVTDGWSMHILIREVGELYRAAVSRTQPLLKPLPIQYADVAVWQRERLQGPALERSLSYWRAQLQGAPPLINLPTDRPRPPIQTFRGAHQSFELSRGLTVALKALSQREDATLFMTLLTALNCLLARYTGQTDVLVGSPIANRTHEAFKDVIGFFVNMLVLRADLRDNPRYLDVLRQARTVCLEAYAHQDLPFEKLIETLQLERTMSHQPLVQVVLVVQNTPSSTIALPELTLTPLPVGLDSAKFDLTMTLTEVDERLLGGVEYNVDLFEAATISRLIQHFQTLLQTLVDDPTRQLSDLALLSPDEKMALIQRWNRHARTFPITDCLHERFERHASTTPDAVAVVDDHAQISYGELNARANQLAHYLRALGVGPEQLVGFYLERSIEMIIAVLGILKIGGAYLPLDPAYPAERIDFILDDSQVRLVLSQQPLAQQLRGRSAQIIRLDADWQDIATYARHNLRSVTAPEHLAYVIYTSGSTGRPKGALLTHAHVARLFAATDHWFGFGADDVWTLFHSIAFDFSVWELWGALLYGGRLVIVPYLTSRSPEAFAALLRAEHVTMLSQTPSAFRQLIPADAALPASASPSALRHVIFGGEALDPTILQPWFERYGDQRPQLVNMYGITETTVHVTYRPILQTEAMSTQRSLIGQPIPDLRLYLLDVHGEPVPAGLPGELYVGGAGVARGYGSRPALTAERFVPDPFSGMSGARLYRSGDLARETFDGDLEYLGRGDGQVKLRGFRIELGEISAALQQHPAIRETVVLLREDSPGSSRLVAYIVTDGTAPTAGELRAFLKLCLPEYMLPATFLPLAALPLTPNGKLDQRALPEPDPARPALDNQLILPSTPAERELASIWQELLKLEQVGVHDSFFALGGDSIRSVQLISLARQRGLELTLQDVFQYQTIAELAQHLHPIGTDAVAWQPVAPFTLITAADRDRLPANVEDAYPLTTLQRGMLFHSAADQQSGVYHDVVSVHLGSRPDIPLLRAAIEQLTAQHNILRTSFDLVHYHEPLQLVHRSASIPLAIADLSDLSPQQARTTIQAWMALERIQPFAWDQPPLLRLQIHYRSDETTQFSVSFHHAILDGWSLASLLTELFQRYIRLALNPDLPLLPSAEQLAFRDYVALEIAALASEQHRAYWRVLLHGRASIRLPRLPQREQPAAPSTELIVYQVPVTGEVSDGLHQLTRKAGVPIKSVLLAAHLRVLATLGGTSDVLTGLVVHGRPPVANSERVLGLFLNTVPFRLALSGGSWIDLAQATFAAERAMQPFIHYPMAQIQQLVGGEPLFEIIFNFTNFHVYQQISALSEMQVLDTIAFERTNFSLAATFNLDLDSNAVSLQLKCEPAALDPEQVERIAGYYERVLAAMAAAPNRPYIQCSPLSSHEYQQLIVAWNDVPTPALKADAIYIHQAFAAQARRTPERTAVAMEGRSLSYAELDQRANQLAHTLRQHRVGANQVVAICAARSPELVVGLLGILKVGAAYLPLDPATPVARRQFMLQDARATLLLTMPTTAASVQDVGVAVLDLVADWPVIAQQPTTAPASSVHPDDLAYVIYTSGSTGQPKGVAVAHRALSNLVDWHQQRFSVTPDDRASQLAGVGFDAAVWEIWPYLSAGASLHLADDATRLAPEALRDWLVAQQITISFAPTPLAERLLTLRWPTTSALRVLLTGGDQLHTHPAPTLPFTVVNNYGPTETTVVATSASIPASATAAAPPSIGQPIANAQVYVLDGQLEPVPVGVAGELYIGGAGVARGYLHQPALTAARFMPHPWTTTPGARLYRTGDWVCWLPDGQLNYLGRIDGQIKLRGFRIELGEIEAVLRQQPDVLDAVVLLREDSPGDQRLVAYVVPSDEARPGDNAARAGLVDRLFDALKAQLAGYMLPSVVVLLDTLPLSPNGKLDRRSLPKPEAERQLGAQHVAPRDALERQLVEIWEAVLDVQPIGINDDFFALGGHSLTALRLMAQIEHQIGMILPLSTLLRGTTVAAIAEAIRQQRPMQPIGPLVPIQTVGARPPFFCVHPAGGDVLCYQALAQQLGTDQPFYALQAVGLLGEQAPDTTIEAMAARYLVAVQEQQPAGPYYLGGWSVGGIVAFEMARQLQARGQSIGALVLFDSQLAHPGEPVVENDLQLLRAFIAQIQLGSADQAFVRDILGARSADEALDYALSQIQQPDRSSLDPPMRHLVDRFGVFKAHAQAKQRYQPATFDGHVCLIQAREQPAGPALDIWRPLVTSMAVHTAAGSHLTMLHEPHVAESAALLERCMASASVTNGS